MYKVLLVDDVKLTLAAEKAYLEGRNLKVFATTSPSEAMDLAGTVQPDLVVLDFEMPEMTGAELCEQLRREPRTSHIPVLILSIHDDEATIRRCTEAGAVGFVRKIDGREALLDNVAKVLGVPRRRHVRLPCRCIAGITDNGQSFVGLVQDVSVSGAFLTTEKRFASGTALQLRFKLPGVEDEIQVLGEIVRTERLINAGYGFGIQFLETNPQSRDVLKEFIERSI